MRDKKPCNMQKMPNSPRNDQCISFRCVYATISLNLFVTNERRGSYTEVQKQMKGQDQFQIDDQYLDNYTLFRV